MRILLTGASGLVGPEVARRAAGDHEVRRLVRREPGADEYRWDPSAGTLPTEAIEWADAVISLSGASLARLPWTAEYRAEILRSRTDATGTIARVVSEASSPPQVWVSASAVGIYGDRPGETLTEESAPGTGYLADVVRAWERACAPASASTRVVNARTGLVIAKGGALKPLVLTTRFGLGAAIGDGRQHWPWVGLADEARALLHLATASALSGPVNIVGPEQATSREVTTALAQALRRPHLLRLPRFALKAAMGLAAEELLLADQAVVPEALLEEGFVFEETSAAQAVAVAVTRP